MRFLWCKCLYEIERVIPAKEKRKTFHEESCRVRTLLSHASRITVHTMLRHLVV